MGTWLFLLILRGSPCADGALFLEYYSLIFASECLADRALWEDARRPHPLKIGVDPRIPGRPFVFFWRASQRGQEMEGP
jgi:hypothetical protein